ncbi:DNA-binding transcriptional regulator, GntR family [Actinopolyspora xinjiangensis]|uniref:DNA-binding transcriptional regulator, GntR family n=1 Tax=Actinopolyspora xinjiangensis TaxID=405564 RepID=A0A1H0WUM9_9ACTN|nr:GntR family transcriptional regulator [Actinopolyspora xinjiangensis]SDP93906.1 DNA-binding transcriptional regulator, GntR family [Actinopolyspora xinjiangensis]
MSNTTSSETIPASPTSTGDHEREPAADRAYRHVKTGLLDGSYPDGHLLSEGEIAQTLRMSRTPVREAFLRLQSEGFLRLYPKRGALVVPITPAEAHSLMEARLTLESFAIDKLAALGRQRLAAIGRELLEHPACHPGELSDAETHEADRAFHARLVAAADNPVVTDLYSALRDRQLRITATARTHESSRRAAVTEQHNGLATALRDGDAALAKHRLREHLAHTMRAIGISEHLPHLDT